MRCDYPHLLYARVFRKTGLEAQTHTVNVCEGDRIYHVCLKF